MSEDEFKRLQALYLQARMELMGTSQDNFNVYIAAISRFSGIATEILDRIFLNTKNQTEKSETKGNNETHVFKKIG